MSQRRQHFLYLKWRHSAQRARLSKAILSRSSKPSTLSNSTAPVLSIGKTSAPPVRSPRAVLDTGLIYRSKATFVASTWTQTPIYKSAASVLPTWMETATCKSPEAWVARKESTQELELAYPPLPTEGAEPSYPYCYQSLSGDAVQSNEMWRYVHIHIFAYSIITRGRLY